MAGRDIWVVGELRGESVSPWTLQLLSGARELAGDGGRVTALIADGAPTDALADHGADAVVTVAGGAEHLPVEALASAASDALSEASPRLALFSDSLLGRDAASQVAAALGVPLLSACERIAFEGDALTAARSCFGGQLSTSLALEGGPCVATVREHTFRARPLDGGRSVDVRSVTPREDDRITVLESRPPDPETLDLGEAEVLVSGGLGVGGAEGFQLLDRLAALMGGTIAASRAAVDQGWVGREKQVGQTGRSVAPKLYLACGISGALQHMVGIRDADALVALNIDAHAPIMGEADLAAVGDVSEVLPHLLRELGEKGDAA